MSRLDLLVDGVKHRFVVSTAASESVFPEHLVPSGRLGPKTDVRLSGYSGGELNSSGSYHAKLESPVVDFSLSFTFPVSRCHMPVLGRDFLVEVGMDYCFGGPEGDYIDVQSQRGAKVRLHLFVEYGPEEDGYIFIPYLSRHPPSTSPTMNGSQRKPKQKPFVNDGNVVFFHFETTGFGNDAEIIQIAARCHGATFNVYILPDGDIDPRAAEKNGFVKSGDYLFLRGRVVYVTPLPLAVDKLLAFLRDAGGSAVLAAHNAHPFHAPLLSALIAASGVAGPFRALVRGLADTLPLFRTALQGRAAAGKSFGLEDLAKDLLGVPPPLLGAEESIATLEKLIKAAGIEYKAIIDCAKPLA